MYVGVIPIRAPPIRRNIRIPHVCGGDPLAMRLAKML